MIMDIFFVLMMVAVIASVVWVVIMDNKGDK